jgi:hypothetical protein
VCQKFASTLVADRCEPCAGVLPLDFTATAPAEPQPGADQDWLCAELGGHELDDTGELCECGGHRLRVCARCLRPEASDCGVSR